MAAKEITRITILVRVGVENAPSHRVLPWYLNCHHSRFSAVQARSFCQGILKSQISFKTRQTNHG